MKSSFRYIIRVSDSLDADQARQNVGPDLGSDLSLNCLQWLSACLQWLSADRTSRLVVKELKSQA